MRMLRSFGSTLLGVVLVLFAIFAVAAPRTMRSAGPTVMTAAAASHAIDVVLQASPAFKYESTRAHTISTRAVFDSISNTTSSRDTARSDFRLPEMRFAVLRQPDTAAFVVASWHRAPLNTTLSLRGHGAELYAYRL